MMPMATKTWYAYEIADIGGYCLGVYKKADERDEALRHDLTGHDDIEGWKVGTVSGGTSEDAMTAIRLDDWDTVEAVGK
jgi:hypothetical protein